jgi:glycosyltransferase involved in cell wall biosynthesis
MPVDAPNQSAARHLKLDYAITYTQFGLKELRMGGYAGPCAVIPHGVDTDIYYPEDRLQARSHLQIQTDLDPNELFIIGNVNRNQPRKRLDLTLQYWTEWWVTAGQPRDSFLYLHCSNNDPEGYNILQLADYYGITQQLILTNKNMTVRNCMFERDMRLVYSMFDGQMSTTLGEGWGLTQNEGMACGVPQICPRYSALAEWCADAVHFTEIESYSVTPNQIGTIGGVPSMESTVEALNVFYRSPQYRDSLAMLGYQRAIEPRFSWTEVAKQFDQILTNVASAKSSGPVGIVR